MKITKFGHCCLLIEENGVKILTDPGSFTTAQNDIAGVDLLLITHEHQDHFHVDSVKAILKNNPDIAVITNSAVGKLLEKEGIKYQVVEDGQSTDFKGVKISGHGTKHAEIWKEIGQVINTGYIISGRMYLPGDAFYLPGVPVEILALPTAGPWLNFHQAIQFAIDVKPQICFPVHDEILGDKQMFFNGWFAQILQSEGLKMVVPKLGEEIKEIQ